MAPPMSSVIGCQGLFREPDINHQRWSVTMRSDNDIRRDVEDELRWDPDIDATDIAVSVHNGVVTLSGFVRSYMQKYQAGADVKRVAGVVAVANDIEVRLPEIDERPDPEIARDAIERIKSELPYAWDRIRVVLK